MKVSIDKDLCTGCGLCTDTCSEVFEMQDDTAAVKVNEVAAKLVDKVKQAQNDCPVEAIKIE